MPDFAVKDNSYVGEDYLFCDRARAAGFQVWVDPTIKLGHMGVQEYEGDYGNEAFYPRLVKDEKIRPALDAINEIDPDAQLEFAVEQTVSFGDLIPGVFGSCDLIGRIGDRAIILDWKFGDGVAVEAEENSQLLFYTAAAIRTPALEWVFKDAKEIECIIVQPPKVKRWVTSFDRVRQFERELTYAVKQSAKPDAPLKIGELSREVEKYLSKVAAEASKIASERKKWIAFTPSVKNAESLADKLNSLGIVSAVVCGDVGQHNQPQP